MGERGERGLVMVSKDGNCARQHYAGGGGGFFMTAFNLDIEMALRWVSGGWEVVGGVLWAW